MKGFFVIDFVACLPLDYFMPLLNEQSTAHQHKLEGVPVDLTSMSGDERVFRLLRLLRLAKMIKLSSFEAKIQNYII